MDKNKDVYIILYLRIQLYELGPTKEESNKICNLIKNEVR